MKFAHIREANISYLQSKYFTAKLFHLPARANFVEKSTHCLGRQMCAFFWCGRRDIKRRSHSTNKASAWSLPCGKRPRSAGAKCKFLVLVCLAIRVLRPSRRTENKKASLATCSLLVRETGLEPVRRRHTPLKRARLPIPPLPQRLYHYTTLKSVCQ